MAPKRQGRKPHLEVRSRVDNGWYDGDVSLEGTRLRVHYNFFGDDDDEFWDVESLNTVIEVNEVMRLRSKQLQDSECKTVTAGMIVCANFKAQDGSESKYYDAKVVAVRHSEHSFRKQRGKQELCKCRFIVAWEDGPNKHQEVDLGCGEISLISTEDLGQHPVAKLVLRGVQSSLGKSNATGTNEQEDTPLTKEDMLNWGYTFPDECLLTNEQTDIPDTSKEDEQFSVKLKNVYDFNDFLGNQADQLQAVMDIFKSRKTRSGI